MSYKPDEGTWMAYLYGELEGSEKDKVERYLAENPDARQELGKLEHLRSMMGFVKDKEVIAPPIVIDNGRSHFNWQSPLIKTLLGIAASLVLIILVGKLTDIRMSAGNGEFRIAFGDIQPVKSVEPAASSSLTSEEVQRMIEASLERNNDVMQSGWEDTQEKLDATVRSALALNSSRLDKLVQQASAASQDQIRDYVSSLQTQNAQLVKEYFQLAKKDQNQYIEDLLVDFAKYLQQQRKEDMILMQARLNSIEQNTDLFKQETEQILTSIISNANTTKIKY